MEHFENWYVVSSMLIIYGVAFLLIEKKKKNALVADINNMSYKTALLIGLFQVLSIIPGTSRSGATILGAMLIGCSRAVAAEFSFFLAIPVMVGVSFLKIITTDEILNIQNLTVLLTGMVTAYIVSMASIRFLMEFVKKHNFKSFGKYRIILGLVIILYFVLI
jgi:undecaprenyl-diphosphatase